MKQLIFILVGIALSMSALGQVGIVGGTYVPIESNGGVPVNLQDQTSLALDLRFIQAKGAPTTLSAQANPNDTTITITSTTGFTDGNVVGVFTAQGLFYFGRQVGAPVGSVIYLDTPIDKTFASGSNVIAATDNMAVDGSATTQTFQIGPVGGATGVEIDITRLMGYIQSDGVPTQGDGLFGNIAALTYGIVLRQNNTVINNIWNIKSNGEFGLLCFDINYTENPPAGSQGFRFRNTYAGQSKHGVTIRLAPGDVLELLIQDDLTDLEVFNMMAQGHVVTD